MLRGKFAAYLGDDPNELKLLGLGLGLGFATPFLDQIVLSVHCRIQSFSELTLKNFLFVVCVCGICKINRLELYKWLNTEGRAKA